MPFHRIYAAKGLFSATDKKEISESITSMYTGIGLPAFYVIVAFVELDEEENFFIGGESAAERRKRTGKPFVRIVSQHLAATMVGDRRRSGTNALDAKFDKWVRDRGYEWELHIEEHPRDLWRHPSVAEKSWSEANEAAPFAEEDGKAIEVK